MKNFFKVITSFGENQLDQFIFEIDKQYFVSLADIPDLYKVRNAHQNLFAAYVKIISIVSDLDFIVITLPPESLKNRTLLKKIIAIVFFYRTILRFFTLCPLVKLLAETHIRSLGQHASTPHS